MHVEDTLYMFCVDDVMYVHVFCFDDDRVELRTATTQQVHLTFHANYSVTTPDGTIIGHMLTYDHDIWGFMSRFDWMPDMITQHTQILHAERDVSYTYLKNLGDQQI